MSAQDISDVLEQHRKHLGALPLPSMQAPLTISPSDINYAACFDSKAATFKVIFYVSIPQVEEESDARSRLPRSWGATAHLVRPVYEYGVGKVHSMSPVCQ